MLIFAALNLKLKLIISLTVTFNLKYNGKGKHT